MCIKRFLQDCRGSLAPMFALAIIPALGFVGAAIDYSHANSVKSAMQAALDSTVLMLSKEAPTMSTSQLSQKGTTYFQALFNRPEAANVVVTPVFDAAHSTLTMNGTATMATNFMKVMGFPSLTITGSSTVTWGNTRLRVALVLDNTGSMADYNKIGALKTATKNLLTTLQNASTNVGDVYVSIVPFVKDVAVDTSLRNSNWIDWTDWDANNGSCSHYKHKSQGAPTNPSDCASRSGTWTADNHNTWNGCITDRGNSNGPASGNYDTNVAAPNTSITASLFPAEQYDSCPQPVMGLNYNWSAMTTLVNNMSPNGNTNQAIGLAWGWLSLVGGGPFTVPAMNQNYQYQQIIILLTDGLNTQNRWYTDQSSIDAREQITCSNVKASGITVYTVQVNTGGDPTSTLLKNCATDSSKFFLLTSASAIVSTFNQIGTQISQLRISK